MLLLVVVKLHRFKVRRTCLVHLHRCLLLLTGHQQPAELILVLFLEVTKAHELSYVADPVFLRAAFLEQLKQRLRHVSESPLLSDLRRRVHLATAGLHIPFPEGGSIPPQHGAALASLKGCQFQNKMESGAPHSGVSLFS